jgi:hypothetical protein
MDIPPESPRKKPGRPRIKGYVSARYDEVHSERVRQNRYYAGLAMVALGVIDRSRLKVPDRYRYFLPAGDTFWRAKWDVLAQLERIDHAPMLRFFADQVCKLNCPAKEAVRLIRKWHHSVPWQGQPGPSRRPQG